MVYRTIGWLIKARQEAEQTANLNKALRNTQKALKELPEGYKKLLAQHEEVHAINAKAKRLAEEANGRASASASPFARSFAIALIACTSSCWASSFL